MDTALFAPAVLTLPRDDWSKIRAAAGRLPLDRSVAPRALEGAWRALDAALRASPPGTRAMRLELPRGQHVALSDAAMQAALPRARPGELAAIRAYARLVEDA